MSGRSLEIRSGKAAGRFSRKEVTPSRASPERPRAWIPRLSARWASIGWDAPAMRQINWRVRATETGEVLSAISRAKALAAGNLEKFGHLYSQLKELLGLGRRKLAPTPEHR